MAIETTVSTDFATGTPSYESTTGFLETYNSEGSTGSTGTYIGTPETGKK